MLGFRKRVREEFDRLVRESENPLPLAVECRAAAVAIGFQVAGSNGTHEVKHETISS